jgi:hypothetical protein
MDSWTKQDILENLKKKALNSSTTSIELRNIVDNIKTMGKAGIYTLSELMNKPILVQSELEYITKTINELNIQKQSL